MQLILTTDVKHLGKAGQLVKVKAGYARNYLVPQGLAISANTKNVKKLEHEQAAVGRRIEKQRKGAEAIAGRINGMTLQFERLVGEGDKLFGSVTSLDIARQLEVANLNVSNHQINLADPIKALGKYEVEIDHGANISSTLKFWVVGKSTE